MPFIHNRRHFLAGLSAAGAASLLGAHTPLAAEPPPEVTRVRLGLSPAICVAPWFVAEDLLPAEGITDVQYVRLTRDVKEMLADGELDFTTVFSGAAVAYVEVGVPVVAVAGLHPGCFELFAHDPSRTISDLRGRRVAIDRRGAGKHIYVSVMAASVGLDPHRDIEWVEGAAMNPGGPSPIELFMNREVDAFLGFPPEPQRLREGNAGRVIIHTTFDRPWSQYVCCMMIGHRDFVAAHPIATKKVIRAVLKGNEICAADPAGAARRMVERGFADRYDHSLETVSELPFSAWRDFDAEDSMRFFALRLHQVGLIQSSPNELLAAGTDWRFLHELKQELKI
jgi:NitT/TauT family transport system substrate-binding protein